MTNIPEPILRGNRRDYPIEMVVSGDDIYRRRNTASRFIFNLPLPDWQRPIVWETNRMVAFIEGIFMGFGCGYYVKNGSDWYRDGTAMPMSGWLIDGQQRINAIREFIENGLVIFDGVTWGSMSKREQLRFLREPFPCVELDYIGDESKLITLYNRLNFGGIAHTEDQRV